MGVVSSCPSEYAMQLKGIVLAGGKSSRFGTDKSLAMWEGKTLLERAVDLLDTLQLDPAVITNNQREYSFLSCRIERDLIPSKGPMGGLYTACRLFKDRPLLVLTCDMPLLTGEVLKQLRQNHRNSDQATVFCIDHALQPFPGIYSADLKMVIHDCLVSDKLSMKLFLSSIVNKRVVRESSSLKAFQNVNRQKDLELITVRRKSGLAIRG